MEQYKKFTFDNGVRLITHNMPARQSLALGIWIKAGGRYEDSKNKGISHFLEHLVFKGSRKYNCYQIKESIEGIGGSLNGFTSEELTCYLVKIPSRYLSLALDVLSDMVINPLLPSFEIEKEKHVILEEIKMYKDLPQSYVYELLDELLWPGQPLGSPIIGSFDSVQEMKRKDLLSFQQRYYTSSNIIVSVAGNLNYSGLIKALKEKLSLLKKGTPNIFLKAKEEQKSPQSKIFYKDTEQTHLALGFHSFRRDHPLKHALGILHIILGANMSSRLFNQIREKKGLAYEIGTVVKRFQDTGSFIVHAGMDNKKVPEAIELILKELKKIKINFVSKDEFKRAKEFYLGQLMLALEDTLDHMIWIGESTASLGRAYTLSEIVSQVDRTTIEDVRQVAQDIFKEEKLNLALIGPLKNKHPEIYSKLNIS